MDIKPADSKAAKKEPSNPLGISRAIYALGNSVKDALIWGTAATVGVIGIANLGRKKGNFIDEAVLKLERLQTNKPKFMDKIGQGFKKVTGKELDLSAPVIAASVLIGWLVGHVVQIPSGIKGWNAAQKAVDKYAVATDENRQLVTLNKELTQENQQFKAALASKKDIPFTERIQQAPAEAGVANAR